nr:hypothetical protein [uncultured Albidiferax sp.]
MARTESVLSIFLASPGDVTDERNRLADAISEWNKTWARNLGVRLEVIRWEDDAYPGSGVDAQDVINQQLPQDYDLFIGIMWTRFGTPTARAGSGTAEEFDRALQMNRSGPGKPNIFFYFKDSAVPPSKIDTDQLVKLQNFKQRLKTEGILHWEFADIDQFEKLVTLHFTRHVQSWRHAQQRVPTIFTGPLDPPKMGHSSTTQQDEVISDEDDGLLDLIEIFEERIAEVTNIVTRLNDAQNELSNKTIQSTAELHALHSTPEGATAKQVRRLIAKVADEMIQFTARTEAEIPLFRTAINSSMAALIKAATLSAAFDSEHTQTARTAALPLLTSLPAARESMIGFRVATVALPRITKELNQAKRKQVSAVDSLIVEFESAESLVTEAISVMDALIGGAIS